MGSSEAKGRQRWDQVSPGNQVELSLDGFRVHCGDVDETSVDGDVVWVFVGLGERRLFHKDDGYELICNSP